MTQNTHTHLFTCPLFALTCEYTIIKLRKLEPNGQIDNGTSRGTREIATNDSFFLFFLRISVFYLLNGIGLSHRFVAKMEELFKEQ